MRKFLYSWRYYSLGQAQYYECMKKMYKNNLYNLRQGNFVAVILAYGFSLFPIIFYGKFSGAIPYFIAGSIALLFALIANGKIKQVEKQKTEVSKLFLYVSTALFYINIVVFGMYLDIWLHRDNFAVTVMIFIVCALFLFIFSPIFNLCMTLGAMAALIIADVLLKTPEIYTIDICNVVFSGIVSTFFCWRITMLRLVSALNSYKLEDERNKYFDQSTIDELTQLRNRRDFMQTFQRYLNNYRSSDDWLCVAIADIDFFKKFNDFYGHPKGDDCLRAIGGAFNRLKDTMGVYVARVGGEEFALLWFEQEISHVDAVVSRVNKLIKALKIPHEQSNVSDHVTLSMGVYVERCGASTDADEIYNSADKALYSAKGNGRNCTIIRGSDISQYQIKAP